MKLQPSDCISRLRDNDFEVEILVYVNVLAVLSAVSEEIISVKEELRSPLKVKELGIFRYNLGNTGELRGKRLVLVQAAYCKIITRQFGMEPAKTRHHQ